MDIIYNLVSDPSLSDEKVNQIRERALSQKFFYFEDWASAYYEWKSNDKVFKKDDWFSINTYKDFWDNCNFWNNDLSFISLWCWDSKVETDIFNHINHPNINYFGIDISNEMLIKSIENIKKTKIKSKKFIRWDFSSEIFRTEIKKLAFLPWYNKIFTFFSNTFGNIKPTNIIDILYNLLEKKDKIRMDVRLRPWAGPKDDIKSFEIMSWYINNKMWEFFLNPIKKVWIPLENWKQILQTHKEDSLDAIRFQFSFLIEKKTNININGEDLTFLPWEKIDLMQIYNYNAEWLKTFFANHGFRLVKEEIKELRWMFLFEKL